LNGINTADTILLTGYFALSYVTITDLHKKFGSTEILKGISFGVERGSFVSLVGPSGCGKSTLLRLIAGLDPLTSGTIEIDGRQMNDMSARHRDIAFVFQSYALYPHMTVRENLGFSLLMRQIPAAEAQDRVRAAAASLGIEELLDRYPRQLSGGQRQRVAMGRAIVRDPKVFLFDEPLSNLDAELRVRMRAEIRELHNRLNATTIYVTHDQVEAMTMSDRIVVLRDGNIEQIGAPLDLYDSPANTFVAGFIGSPAMNIFPATVAYGTTVRLSDGTALEMGAGHAVGTKLICGVRPEHIHLADTGAPAVVRFVEVQGAETLVAAHLGPVELTIVVHERLSLAPGDRIHLTFDKAHVHLFDPQRRERAPIQ
jgi:multiple sugar transport system ATP-binding protein